MNPDKEFLEVFGKMLSEADEADVNAHDNLLNLTPDQRNRITAIIKEMEAGPITQEKWELVTKILNE
jgi:hypothetical protein